MTDLSIITVNNNVTSLFSGMKDALGGMTNAAGNAQSAFLSMSGTMQAMATAMQAAAGSTTIAFNNVTVAARNTIAHINSFVSAIDVIKKGNDSEKAKGSDNQSKGGYDFKEAAFSVADIASGGFSMGGKLAVKAAENGIDFAIEQGRQIKKLGLEGYKTHAEYKTLAGDKEGDKLYGNVGQFIKGSVMGTGVFKDGSTLLEGGIDAGNVLGYIRELSDVSKGDPEKMHSLSGAFGDTYKKGKLTEDNLDEFTGAGFDPLKEISRTTGRSITALKEDMEKGKITFDRVADAFGSATGKGGEYYRMLDKIADTPYGKEQEMSNGLELSKGAVGESLVSSPEYDNVLSAMKPVTDGLGEMLTQMEPYIERLMQTFAELLPHLKGFGGTLLEILKPFGDYLTSDSFKFFAASVIDAANSIGKLLVPILKLLEPVAELSVFVAGGSASLVGKTADIAGSIPGSLKQIWSDWTGGRDKKENPRFAGLDFSQPKFAPIVAVKTMMMNGQIPGMSPIVPEKPRPVLMQPKSKQSITNANEASAAITGGGGKQIIINVNKPFYNVEGDQVFQSVVDAVKDFEPKVREAFLRILQSANAALG